MLMRVKNQSSLTALQQRVAREIVAIARRDNFRSGDHLREVQLAEEIGTSRSPVQAALRHLAQLGLAQQDMNRGYFLLIDAKDWSDKAAELLAGQDDPLYLQIAEERQAGRLTDEVTEAELMRRFDVARSTLRKVLARISEEGWIEQRVGHGWCFLPMIDSPDAYEESYLFRQAIEPTGLLGPSFAFSGPQMAQLKREQRHIVDGGFKTMSSIELFEANSRFHETLALWSHNRFILQSISRVNQLRRLVEYRQAGNRPARQTQASEHLAILSAIEAHDLVQAASLMRAHLDGARRGKSHDRSTFS